MNFEFDNELMPQNAIDIDEVGEFALECTNDEGYCYYIIVRTSLGMSMIATCGPVIPDTALVPGGFAISVNKMPYKEEKLGKVISLFLNDKGRKIKEAKVIDIEDAINCFVDVKDYLENFSEETF